MKLSLVAIENIPLIEPGDNLVDIILDGIEQTNEKLLDDDIIIIAQKIISKSENRYVELDCIDPSDEALSLAKEVDKDPRYVELVLRESRDLVRKKPGVLIVEHQLGFVHANAGIDLSNIDQSEIDPSRNKLSQKESSAGELYKNQRVLLLPVNPDASAEKIRQEIKKRLGVNIAIIINDSIGRAWRNGSMGLAIGVAGMTALDDRLGDHDIFGRELLVTAAAVADELAAAASLIMGQTTERTPVVLSRGYKPVPPENSSVQGVKPLIRDKEMDLFR